MRVSFVDIQHSGYTHGLLGTVGKLELRNVERRGVGRLAFNDVGLRVSWETLTCDVARNGPVCVCQLWESLRRDSGADL